MKRLNLRLAVILSVTMVVSIVGIYFLHEFQINRNAGNLLVESRRLKDANNMKGAEKALSRYVAFRPDDAEAQEEILEIHKKLFEQEPNARNYKTLSNSYERMITLQPDNAEIRRSYAKLCLDIRIRNTIVAQQQLAAIRKLGKSNADDEYNEAILTAIKNPESAIPLLAKIIGYDPETKVFNPEESKKSKQYRAYFDLATVYQQQPVTADLAPLIIEELTTQHADVVDAQRFAYEYWIRQGQMEKARLALAKAVQIAPDDVVVMNLQFRQYLQSRDFKSALTIAERLEKLAPKSEDSYLNLATIYEQTKQRDKALESLERGLALSSNRARLLLTKLKLTIQNETKDQTAARAIFAQLQGMALPPEALGLMSLFEGQILLQETKYSAALDKLEAASKRLTEPLDQLSVEYAQALCYTALGSYDLARTIYEKILNTYPGMYEVRVVLANLLLRTGKPREAQREFELLYRGLPAETILSQPRIWQPLLDCRMTEQLAKPVEKRDWTGVNELVGKLKELPNEVLPEDEKTLLQARILAQQGELDQALALVLPLREQQPENMKYWVEWSLLESRRRQPRELLKKLAAAPAAVQNDQRMLLLQGNQWVAVGGEEGKAGLLELLNKSAGLDKSVRLTIHLLISQALAQMGQIEEAKKVATLAIPIAEGNKPRDLRRSRYCLATREIRRIFQPWNYCMSKFAKKRGRIATINFTRGHCC